MAAIVQVPALVPVTVRPLTVQTLGVMELKATVSPEVAVALAVVVPPTASVAGAKVIVPMVWLALKLAVTVRAALRVTVQAPVPEHPLPDQPEKVEPLAALAVKVTRLPPL
ncbi:hypothetical protein CCP3SC15_270011 [Gammaproteobacteria bacterium]